MKKLSEIYLFYASFSPDFWFNKQALLHPLSKRNDLDVKQ